MYTQRIAVTALLAALILSSCQTKKAKEPVKKTETMVFKNDPSIDLHKELPELSRYSNGFTESITQHFIADGKRKTIVTAKGGLKVTVDPGSLEQENGGIVKDKIKISIIELTNSNDLFRSNAATTSDGKLLASGGSYFIAMQCDGQKLKIKTGKALMVDFPLLKNEGMELFYGERNKNNDMNWKSTGVALKQQFNSYSPFDEMTGENAEVPQVPDEFIPGRLFRSMDASVYYYKNKITLKQLVDTLNRVSPKVYVETISFWPKNLRTDVKLDTNYLVTTYGPQKQYILRTYKAQEAGQVELEKKKAKRMEVVKSVMKASVSKELAKYYAPANISNLGWINCDRFYNPIQTDVELDLPITLNNTRLEYFIIFRSINGMIKGYIDHYKNAREALLNMPVGEKVTLIAFAKSNGTVYRAKEDITIERRKKLSLDFKAVTPEEMNDIFEKKTGI